MSVVSSTNGNFTYYATSNIEPFPSPNQTGQKLTSSPRLVLSPCGPSRGGTCQTLGERRVGQEKQQSADADVNDKRPTLSRRREPLTATERRGEESAPRAPQEMANVA